MKRIIAAIVAGMLPASAMANMSDCITMVNDQLYNGCERTQWVCWRINGGSVGCDFIGSMEFRSVGGGPGAHITWAWCSRDSFNAGRCRADPD